MPANLGATLVSLPATLGVTLGLIYRGDVGVLPRVDHGEGRRRWNRGVALRLGLDTLAQHFRL